mmetsp:Transcript_9182/g.14105  ORF Transcript_9182/g.14105 Transcript_9182/m.14105 type:complete len:338 (-) Transcript_9182:21-1034(-)
MFKCLLSKNRKLQQLEPIPLATGPKSQDELPKCTKEIAPPKCYKVDTIEKIKKSNGTPGVTPFQANRQYDFVLLGCGEVRWFDQTQWQTSQEYKKMATRLRKKYKKTGSRQRPDPYLGHESMFNKDERKMLNGDNSPVVFAGEFFTDDDGKIYKWNAGSGHFRLFDWSRFKDQGWSDKKIIAQMHKVHLAAAKKVATLLGLKKKQFEQISAARLEYLNNLQFDFFDSDDADDFFDDRSMSAQQQQLNWNDNNLDMVVHHQDHQLPFTSSGYQYIGDEMSVTVLGAYALIICAIVACCMFILGLLCGFVSNVLGNRIFKKLDEERVLEDRDIDVEVQS